MTEHIPYGTSGGTPLRMSQDQCQQRLIDDSKSLVLLIVDSLLGYIYDYAISNVRVLCVRVLQIHQGLGCFQAVLGILKELHSSHWSTSVGAIARKGEHLIDAG